MLNVLQHCLERYRVSMHLVELHYTQEYSRINDVKARRSSKRNDK